MDIIRFGPKLGQDIKDYGSRAVRLLKVADLEAGGSVRCMYLEQGSELGYHQATCGQLFLVVSGDGWVRGEGEARTPIRAGLGAVWKKDEWHAAGTDSGMTAIILEAEAIHPVGLSVL